MKSLLLKSRIKEIFRICLTIVLICLISFNVLYAECHLSQVDLVFPDINFRERNSPLPVKFDSRNFTNVSVVKINEVVTEPKSDWSTNNFNGTPGSGSINEGTDEWIELLINETGLDLTGWTIELLDGSNVIGDLTGTGAFDVSRYIGSGSFSSTVAGDYLVLGNVDGTGAMNNSITINLKDASGTIVDAVTFGSSPLPSGNSDDQYNESAQRFPNGTDTDNAGDWIQGQTSLGTANTGPSVKLSVSPASVSENNSNSIVTAILCAKSSQPTTVNLSISGTATLTTDFTISTTTITIPAGNTTGTATVTSVQDTKYESDETIIIDISSVTNGTEAGTQQQTITILNDDSQPSVTLSLSGSTFAENGGTTTVTATLSNLSYQDVTVNLDFSGTATNISDYSRSNTSFTILSGATTGSITLTGVDDAAGEGNETVIVDISSVTNGTESGAQQVTATILDDDFPTVVAVSATTGNGFYKVSDVITLTIIFSVNVVVTGTPQLRLETGTTDRTAGYSTGSGTNTLSFTYSVQPGDISSDLDYVATNSLTLNGGSIQGNSLDAELALPTPGAAGSLGANKAIVIDTDPPTVTIGLNDSDLKIGETATVTFTFSEPVSGFTNADITVPNGSLTDVSSSDGGITFTAIYTPDTNNETNSNRISINELGVTDQAGNPGSGTASSGYFINDTKCPTATLILNDYSLKTGDVSIVRVDFSEQVTDFDVSDLIITNGNISNFGFDGYKLYVMLFTPNTNCEDSTNVISLDLAGVADIAGNAGSGTTSSANFVIDTKAPVLVCHPDTTVVLDNSCHYTIGDLSSRATATDICSTIIVTQTLSGNASLTFEGDMRTDTIKAEDCAGNINYCTFKITADDTIRPAITCLGDTTVYLNPDCEYAIGDLRFRATASDNCGTVTLSQRLSGSATLSGDGDRRTVTITANDGNGNTNDCSFTITALDTIRPAIVCLGDTTVYLNSNCEYVVGDLRSRATASDNCGSVTLSQRLSGDATLSGDGDSRLVTITANDGNGNPDSCSFTITALDTIRPMMICHDTIIYLDNAGQNIFRPQLLIYGSSDNCGIVSVSPDNFIMDCENIANTIAPQQPWINEFHYDNTGTDVNEFVEIAGSAGFDLSGYKLLFYNGSDGSVYKTTAITGIIPDESGGYGTRSFLIPGIQNGPAEGIALITPSDSTVQFISYEGTIQALDGAAIGLNSTDVGVSESTTAPTTASLAYLGAAWVYMASSTAGNLNPAQILPGKSKLYEISAFDEAGNNSTCQSRIEVRDTIPPIPLCHDMTIYLNQYGEATLAADTVGMGSSDNCGIKGYRTDKTTFSCDNVGENSVHLTVTDLSGNESGCDAIITVADTIPPTALCRNTEITLDSNGSATLTASMINNNSSDNCGIRSLAISKDIFSCTDSGTRAVTLTVTDESGLTSTCQSTVTVKDMVKPVAICKDTTLYLDSAGRGYVSPLDIAGQSTDNCSVSSWSLDKNIFSGKNLGKNTVHASVEDRSGNSSTCTATITIVDTIRPVLICRDTTLFLDASGNQDIDTRNLLPIVADNCGVISITPDTISLDCSDSRVALASGLPHFNEFHYDNAGTDVNEFVEIAGKAGTNLSGFKILFYNGTDSSVYKTLNLSGIIVDQIDGYGAVSFAVSGIQNGPDDGFALIDSESKTIDFISYEGKVTAAEGEASGLTSDETGVWESADSPVGTSISLNTDGGWELASTATPGMINPGQHWPLTTRTIRISATDASGNTSGCYSHIEIIDNLPPTAICQNLTISLDENGEAAISDRQIDGGSFDNCTIDTVYISQTNFDSNDLGPNQVVLTVADNSGNTSNCKATVTITDTIRPTAKCKDISIELDQNGIVVVSPEQVNNGSTDNCGIQTLSLSQNRFDCSDIGQNLVELSMADASGNISVCQATLTIEDSTPAIIVCHDVVVVLDSIGSTGFKPESAFTIQSDNCHYGVVSASQTLFDCGDTGYNSIELTYTDGSGNRSTCQAMVTIVDTIAPKTICKETTIWLYENRKAHLSPGMIDGGTTDNCGVLSLETDKSEFSYTEVGQHQIVLQATDRSGNSSTCVSTVTVLDTLPPKVVCKDTVLYLDPTGSTTIEPKHLVLNAKDFIGISPEKFAFDCPERTSVISPEKPWINEFHYDNDGTDEGEFVEIAGKAGINLSGYKLLLYNGGDGKVYKTMALSGIITDETGGYGAVSFAISQIQNGPADGFALVSPSGEIHEFISYEGTLVATDGNALGKTSTGVGVEEQTTAPVGSSIFLNATKTWRISKIASPGKLNPGQHWPVVIENATVAATDYSGNQSTCISHIEIRDTIAPQVVCHPAELSLTENGEAQLTTEMVMETISDNCSIEDFSLNKTLFGCADLGENSVILTATDLFGNKTAIPVLVQIIDQLPPVFSPVADFTVSLQPGICKAKINYPEITATDNCSVQINLVEGKGEDVMFGPGIYTEKYVAKDAAGNTDSLEFTVTVVATNGIPAIDNIPLTTIAEDSPLAIQLTGITDGDECIQQNLTFKVTSELQSVISGLTIEYTQGATTALVKGTLKPDWFGETLITITLSDNENGNVTRSFILRVTLVNDPPVLITPLPDFEVNAAHTLKIPVPSNPSALFYDPDDEHLTISASEVGKTTIPGFITLSNDSIIIYPMITDTGRITIVIKATDSHLASASDTFDVVVLGYKTGIGEITTQSFPVVLYPNPASHNLNILLGENVSGDVEVEIYSVEGSLKIRRQYRSAKIQTDVSSLTDGLYYIRIRNGSRAVVKNFVMKRE